MAKLKNYKRRKDLESKKQPYVWEFEEYKDGLGNPILVYVKKETKYGDKKYYVKKGFGVPNGPYSSKKEAKEEALEFIRNHPNKLPS